MIDFIHEHQVLLLWLAIIGFIGSLIVIPWILIKIPSDYFLADKRKKCPWGNCSPIIRLIVLILKNILGLILVFGGIIMLFTPGQGMITIIGGIILMDFPYKYNILRRIIKHPKILSPINALRMKAKQAPLEI